MFLHNDVADLWYFQIQVLRFTPSPCKDIRIRIIEYRVWNFQFLFEIQKLFRIYTAGYKDIGIKIIEHMSGGRSFPLWLSRTNELSLCHKSQPDNVNLWYFKLSWFDPIIHSLKYLILSCQDIGIRKSEFAAKINSFSRFS